MGVSSSNCGMCSSNNQQYESESNLKLNRSSMTSQTQSKRTSTQTEPGRQYERNSGLRSVIDFKAAKDSHRISSEIEQEYSPKTSALLEFAGFNYERFHGNPDHNQEEWNYSHNNKENRNQHDNQRQQPPVEHGFNQSYMSGVSLLEEFNAMHVPETLKNSNRIPSNKTLYNPIGNNARKLKITDFKSMKLLSKSSRSSVYFCVKDNIPFALKIIPRTWFLSAPSTTTTNTAGTTQSPTLARLETVYNEKRILEKLFSSHTVNLEYAFTDATNVYLVMDYKPNGTLAEYLQRKKPQNNRSNSHSGSLSSSSSSETSSNSPATNPGSNHQNNSSTSPQQQHQHQQSQQQQQQQHHQMQFEERKSNKKPAAYIKCDFIEIQRIIAQIVACLWFVHEEQQLIYRGLQPENILFDELNNVSLCDFTDAQTLDEVEFANDSETLTKLKQRLRVLRQENQAPEQIKGTHYGPSSDYWQLGIIVYQLLYRKHPFSKQSTASSSTSSQKHSQKQAGAQTSSSHSENKSRSNSNSSAASSSSNTNRVKLTCSKNSYDGQEIPWQFLCFLDKCLAPDRYARFQRFIDVQASPLFKSFDWQSVVESYISRFSPENAGFQAMHANRIDAAIEENFSADNPENTLLSFMQSNAHIGSIQDDYKLSSLKFYHKSNNSVNKFDIVYGESLRDNVSLVQQQQPKQEQQFSLESNPMMEIQQINGMVQQDEIAVDGMEAPPVKHIRKQSVKRRKNRQSKVLSEILANDDEDEIDRRALDGDDECSFSSTTTATNPNRHTVLRLPVMAVPS